METGRSGAPLIPDERIRQQADDGARLSPGDPVGPYGGDTGGLRPYTALFKGWQSEAHSGGRIRDRMSQIPMGGVGGVVATIYILYSTGEGQTARIAEYIADVMRARGHEAQTADIRQSGVSVPGGYDGVIVGASIHMGKHDKHAVDYVRNNRTMLEQLPAALFSVSLAAHGDTHEAEGYVEEFEQETGWRPAKVALFSGALLYTQYGFLKRHMMKKIASGKPGNLGTDMSRDYVYTEWDGVKRFAEDFLEELTSKGAEKRHSENAGR